MKNTPFPPLATDAKARRTRKYAYLCTVSEGDRSPPVPAAMKKQAPSATHGSLVVCEQDRTRKNRRKVSRSRTRKSHHLPRIFTTRTPFSPTRMPKRGKGCHFARATERPRAKTTNSRQKAPRATPPPDASFSFKKPRKSSPAEPTAPAPFLC